MTSILIENGFLLRHDESLNSFVKVHFGPFGKGFVAKSENANFEIFKTHYRS